MSIANWFINEEMLFACIYVVSSAILINRLRAFSIIRALFVFVSLSAPAFVYGL